MTELARRRRRGRTEGFLLELAQGVFLDLTDSLGRDAELGSDAFEGLPLASEEIRNDT